MVLITVDSSIELLKINNFFGLTLPTYRVEMGSTYYLTSLFDDEKNYNSVKGKWLDIIE